MKDTFRPLPCAECGTIVQMGRPDGESWVLGRGVSAPIPDHVLVPRCPGCGETYLSEQDAKRVEAAVREAVIEEQVALFERCVGALRVSHGVTLREIEKACGVVQTYFSHLMKPKRRKFASATLTRLLEAYVACPEEFQRQLQKLGIESKTAPQKNDLAVGATPAVSGLPAPTSKSALPRLSGGAAAHPRLHLAA